MIDPHIHLKAQHSSSSLILQLFSAAVREEKNMVISFHTRLF